MCLDRIRNKSLLDRVCSPKEAARLIEDGMNVATSGFTPSGYPKAVPMALAELVKETGENIKINLYTGASVGEELDGIWAKNNLLNKRLPYQTNGSLRDSINNGDCQYLDMHLSHVPHYTKLGFLGKINVAIIEAVAITEEGHIIPSTSVGTSPTYVEMADKVIVEINTSQSIELEGMADIYMPKKPPFTKPIPIIMPNDRIGTHFIPCEIDKIAAIVVTDIKDNVRPLAPIDAISEKISQNLIEFLEKEVESGRLTNELLPLQSGVGSVANAVLGGLNNSSFKNLVCYTEVIQDSMLDLLDSGKVLFASGTSITPSSEGLERFNENINYYKEKIILRPQEISNHPEVIRRLGIIALNTAIEVDIYGNVNSTHIMGSKMMNGIGGSGDFTRNAYLSIFTTPSVAKNGDISSIVPMVSHHDHTEHDVMVIITEQGVADLRGLSPKERGKSIIENCSHPDFRPLLRDYYNHALKNKSQHTPHSLDEALSWHTRFIRTNTMHMD
ncbi:MAG: acetyl-CoA hydrolase/transferase family protein [Anaeromicrobium sp.]|jgi:succinyl-CoA:acetate CoA-transferase|uniref:acetyl-CoA hydrolase/transferase family protein n=1 Tax=Anaeromicrobium sp. TaxID=1929132 RepID=UPI0025F1DCA4|nr:acetyl-CoA hydrolase/transferase family protein [Anaeromicrobium sp.]MCT4595471.1 acetyl-CoA hydrolase/transferase family protein [Anaeromicrobium sp.]